MPAHVTVLYPFVEPAQVDGHIIATLAAVFGLCGRFRLPLLANAVVRSRRAVARPRTPRPFIDLTAAVWEAFPHHPPYGGAHDHVVPHLTIAERSLSAVKTAEQAVQTGLPLSTHIEGVLLIAGTQAPNSWRVLHEFRLRAARSETP